MRAPRGALLRRLAARLRPRLPLQLALLAGGVVALIGLALLLGAQQLLLQEYAARAQMRLEQRADAMAGEIGREIDHQVRAFRWLSRSAALRDSGDLGIVRAELEAFRDSLPAFLWLGVVSPDGVVLAGTSGWLEGTSIRARPVFASVHDGLHVADAHPAVLLAPLLQAAGVPAQELIDLGLPLVDARGRRVGVLVAHAGVRWADVLLRTATRPDAAWSGGARAELRVGPTRRLLHASGVAGTAGAALLGATRDVPLAGAAALRWQLLLTLDRASVLAPARRFIVLLATVGVASALLLGWLAHLVARRVMRPWQPLFSAVQRSHGAAPESGDAAPLGATIEALALRLANASTANARADDAERLLGHLVRDAAVLKRVVDHLPGAVLLLDERGGVDYANASFTRLLGYGVDALRGLMPLEPLLLPAEQCAWRAMWRQIGLPLPPVGGRTQLQARGGAPVAVQWELLPLPASAGVGEQSMLVLHDIGAELAERARAAALADELRRVAEEARAAARQRARAERDLAQALDAAQAGSWRIDLDSATLRWISGRHAVPGGDEEPGVDAGTRFLRRVHPDDRPALLLRLAQAREDGAAFMHEFRVFAEAGALRWLAIRGTALATPEGTELTGVTFDVTARIAAQQALQDARDELAALARKLLRHERQTHERLADALNNDLGQTLAALRLHWELLAALQPAPPAAGVLIESAQQSVHRLLDTLRPPLLDSAGLVPALENELARLAAEHPALTVTLRVRPEVRRQRWPADVEYAALMIARDRVAQALAERGARLLLLVLTGHGGALVLRITDDGAAQPDGATAAGRIGAGERALAIGARLDLRAAGAMQRMTLRWKPPRRQSGAAADAPAIARPETDSHPALPLP